MFELLGSETEHEAACKRTINLSEQIIENYERICDCYTEIKSLEEENKTLERALEHWKAEIAKYYSLLPKNLVVEQTETQKKKPTTK